MPTHWPGSLVDLDALYAIARRHKLRVIEDAALVIGSQWNGRNVGAVGDLVTFSFHPNKNITDDRRRRARRQRRRRGAPRRRAALPWHHLSARPHARCCLPRRQVQPARRQCADRRRAARAAAGVPRHRAARWPTATSSASRTEPACVLPPRPQGDDGQSWNMWSVLLPLDPLTIDRRQFRDALEARGIGTGVSYEALHLSTLGRRYGGRRKAIFRTRSASPARRSRCRCMPG